MSTPYHIGLYALVQHHGTYLIVRQVESTLPSGPFGLPGAALVGEVGSSVAELHLRRKLLTQLGLSVGELVLAGSHTIRNPEGHTTLNLIFSADYNSGVPNPQPGVIAEMVWRSLAELQERGGVPEWLLSAVRTHQTRMSEPPAGRNPGRHVLKWGR